MQKLILSSCQSHRFVLRHAQTHNTISCLSSRSQHRLIPKAAVGDAQDPTDPAQSQKQPSSSSPGSYAIPTGVPSAGAVFVLAGFLKILIMCFPFSVMAVSMYFQGRAELGTWAAMKMMPLAIGVLALAKYLVDHPEIRAKKWFHSAVAVGGIIALILSRLIFARPKPSPLDPYLRAAQEQRIAQVAALQKQREEGVTTSDGGKFMKQPTEDAKKDLQQRGRRFQ